MTKNEKHDKKSADLETVLRDAKTTYGLVKKAAVKGGKIKTQDKAELIGAVAKTAMGVVELAVDQHKKYKAQKKEKERTEDAREVEGREYRAQHPHNRQGERSHHRH